MKTMLKYRNHGYMVYYNNFGSAYSFTITEITSIKTKRVLMKHPRKMIAESIKLINKVNSNRRVLGEIHLKGLQARI